jgi:cyanophycinase
MAIHLIGGGWAEDETTWTGLFLAEAAARCGGVPRLVVILWASSAADGEAWHHEYRADFERLGPCEVRFVQLTPTRELSAADLADADGIFVGGGLTPGYHASVLPARDAIRTAVASGVPYAGFSAGAMIAGSKALVGGWQLRGVPVCPEAAGEGLTEISLGEGLGLVAPVIDVHCAEMGLLGRGVALVDAGLAPQVIAVDECTSAVFDPEPLAAGRGVVRRIDRAPDGAGVLISSIEPIG